MLHRYTVIDTIDNLIKIYHWCCDQWRGDERWEIVDEKIIWSDNKLSVTYEFTDDNKRLLFCLGWVDNFKS